MRVLIYGINYAPELTGIGKYTGEMGCWMAQQGHDISAITAMPYYPEWEVHPMYKGKAWHTEEVDGVKVHRCPLYVTNPTSAAKRIIHEFSFVFSSLVFWLPIFFGRGFDVVLCINPPFHLGFLPLLYSKLRGVPFICHIQDLQVDAARDLGMIKNQRFLNLMLKAERYLLNHAEAVSTISIGMQMKIEKKGIPLPKIIMFPNWVDVHTIRPLYREESLRHELDIADDQKVVLYSGNLGEKQGLDLLIQAAQHLQDASICFLIVGSGGGKIRLEELVKQYGLTNVRFLPLQPYEKLSALLATADLHLVLQKKSAADLVMPSKLTSILAAGGCPLVTALPGTTLYDIVNKNEMGILVEPESVGALVEGINYALHTDLDMYKANARSYADKNIDKAGIMSDFETKLLQLVTPEEIERPVAQEV
ncbi:WcaI family glycosyltransferase [Telluribacter sp. SYSU D00476]|uniref:WcaI family glycosyltransferase n=1 Tax=Telluribacter sp. SYSU D00476 TaxID=2811430 RepID=UPI001FF1131A|nr:WcaI family glycosyltransferase [Telluribacter sp. SYSU D00476]